eukprot:TRINITY_DN9176_c0_g1_i2.p1 TRINITY_DN9176_c0_g1~~TRINITY_DN9176_c0_g1_i2.p1  ORF type:complete len:239 (-),score=21.85 TRINITY_DN9176_c0_g1_i2:109-825(-)
MQNNFFLLKLLKKNNDQLENMISKQQLSFFNLDFIEKNYHSQNRSFHEIQQQQEQQMIMINSKTGKMQQLIGTQNELVGSLNQFPSQQPGNYLSNQFQQQQLETFSNQQPRYFSTAELEQKLSHFPPTTTHQLQQQLYQLPPSTNCSERKPIILETSQAKQCGVLKYFDTIRNYGFIVIENQNQELFFHLQDITHPLLTKEFLQQFKEGIVIKLLFNICTYIGKYNISKKAINLEPML